VPEYNVTTRKALAKSFIENVVLAQYRQLTGWQEVTQQTSQIDSGYLGQHLVSLVSGTLGRGRGGRGKGFDLVDGSEIKVASTLGGIDVPRWNHSSFGNRARVDVYLEHPFVYFLLFDTTQQHQEFPLRIRVWRVSPTTDPAFSNVVRTWAEGKSSGNFQLHPPCWKDESIATNRCGDLDLPLIFEAVQQEIPGVDFMKITRWDLSPGPSKKV
jgi:MamI-like restriction endonuclease